MGRRFLPFAVLAVVVVLAAAWWLSSAPAATPQAVTTSPSTAKKASNNNAANERVLFGEVTTPSGAPLGGARITVVVRGISKNVVAGADGGFTVDPLPDDLDRLEFAATGYVSVVVAADQLPRQAEAFWAQQLALDESIPGVLVFAGTPPKLLAGATLVRVDDVDGRRPRFNAAAVSDDNGRLPRPEPDGHRYFVAHAAHGAVALPDSGAQITLPASATIDGHVVDDSRRPLTTAVIAVRAGAIYDPFVAGAMRIVARRREEVVVDADGHFELHVPAINIVVDATAAGHRPQHHLEVSPRAGVIMPLEIRLQRSPAIAGVVVDSEGAPVVGALVGVDSGGMAGRVRTDDDGHFFLDQLEARPSSLTVEAEGFRTITVGGIDGASSRLDDLHIELVAGTGQAVVGIGVTVGAVEGGGPGILVRTVEAGTPAERAGVVAGEVIVAVDGVNLDDDLNASMGRVRGAPGTSVMLQLQDPRGRRRFLTVERDSIAVPRRARIR